MKVLIALAAFAAVASAGHLNYGAAPVAPAVVSTGHSSQFRAEDNYGNYNFGYDEQHATGGSSRREEMSNGVQRGSYALNDADGRRRMVNYVADDTGFHADIQTNEPGVEPKDSADALVNKHGVAVAGPAYAPVAAPLPAPIAVPAPILAAPRPLPVAGPAYAPLAAPLPAPVAAPAYAPVGPVEIATPRAFSYSFGSTHLAAPLALPAPAPAYAGPAPLPAPVYAAPAPLPLPLPAPVAAPAPVYQERLGY